MPFVLPFVIPPLVKQLGKIFMIAAPFLVAAAAIWFVYSTGVGDGQNRIMAEWNEEKLAHAAQIAELETKIEIQETNHHRNSMRISHELSQANETFARSVAGLDAELANRLHDSDARANRYRAMSDAGGVESANLASHAAELDRSLEQGRRLVKEFGATLEQRDSQLIALGQQILADRALIGGTSETD